VVTVVIAFLVFQFYGGQPNPGHSWSGFWRYLTFTQIYTGDYLESYLHQGLTQTWSLATEVAFYLALPLLAALLLRVSRHDRWRPGVLLFGLGVLAAISPIWLVLHQITGWLPSTAGMWLPANLSWFVAGMMLAVLRTTGVRCYAAIAVPVAVACVLIVSTPIAGAPTMSPTVWQPVIRHVFYAVIATLLVGPAALGDAGRYTRLLSSRAAVFFGKISYEVFLLHVIVMWAMMNFALGWKPFTGSVTALIATTLAVTIPLAWLLHRVTRRRTPAPLRTDLLRVRRESAVA
jgi:peptidoglycan/LPS O-acetylase OafA/YrhL